MYSSSNINSEIFDASKDQICIHCTCEFNKNDNDGYQLSLRIKCHIKVFYLNMKPSLLENYNSLPSCSMLDSI